MSFFNSINSKTGRSFFIDYGGPGDEFFATDRDTIASMEDEYENTFIKVKKTEFFNEGLKITLIAYGIHRCLLVQETAEAVGNAEKEQRFEKARGLAYDFTVSKYHLLSNNCVTACSNTLHAIDAHFSKKLVFPWALDKEVKKYLTKPKYTPSFQNKRESKDKCLPYLFFKPHHRSTGPEEISSIHQIIQK